MPYMIDRRRLLGAMTCLALMPAFSFAEDKTPATGSTPKTIAEQLADYVAATQYSALPPDIVERVKAHFIDAMGCAIGAINQPQVQQVRSVALAAMPGGVSTLIGTTHKTSMDLASFANGAAVRYFDLNDSYAGKEVGHPSDNITPCLAVAEAQKCSGQDLILAIALAYEIDCQLLDTVQISARGWDHPNFSLPAAALAAGKLMRLSTHQLTEAVNLSFAGHMAMNQTRLQVLSNWKGLADAEAGRNAVFAVQLARAGLTGPAPAFEGNAGFFKQISGPFTLDTELFGGRAGTFKIAECQVKPYPAQALLQTAIVAAARVGKAIPDTASVKSIVIATTRAGHQYSAESPDKFAPKTRETADHSLPYIVVRAMLDHEIKDSSYSDEALQDPRLVALLKKLTVEEDDVLTKMSPQRLPTRVTVTLEDGRVITEQVDDLPGFGGKPLDRRGTEEKFFRSVNGVWSQKQSQAFFDVAWQLDQQRDLSHLLRLMIVKA
ncbi:MmgE/PrpD family protein [Pseudomonas sp. NA-150]|uniref:MmgE/PrpD family protein n=1 Tax=Pseudomonas sp. NA-150 TaxID=3367525 RepID=UPI0037CC47AD